MRISLLLPGFGPLKATVRQAELAERSGLDGVWIAEHVGFHDAPVTTAFCLARTTDLEVGLMGLAPGSRNPALTAMEIASLAEFAPGRVRVQLGTGELSLMSRIGVDPAKPAARVAAFVRVIRSLLNGETLTEESLIGRYQEFSLNRPGQALPIPLDVLAIRPKMLALAAESGDGICMTGGASRDYIRSTIESIRNERSARGLAGSQFRNAAIVFALIADEWSHHVDSLAGIASGFSPSIAPVILRGALAAEQLEQFEGLKPEARLALFTPEVLQEIAIVCKPAEVVDALADRFDLGLDEICIFPVGPQDLWEPALATMGRAISSLRGMAHPSNSIKEEAIPCP